MEEACWRCAARGGCYERRQQRIMKTLIHLDHNIRLGLPRSHINWDRVCVSRPCGRRIAEGSRRSGWFSRRSDRRWCPSSDRSGRGGERPTETGDLQQRGAVGIALCLWHTAKALFSCWRRGPEEAQDAEGCVAVRKGKMEEQESANAGYLYAGTHTSRTTREAAGGCAQHGVGQAGHQGGRYRAQGARVPGPTARWQLPGFTPPWPLRA